MRLALLVLFLAVVLSVQVGARPGPLAFVRDGDIYTASADGANVHRLTTDGRNGFPMWSPDGRYIAFSKAYMTTTMAGHQMPGAALWIITSDGKYSRAVIEPEMNEAYYPASWLPDGSGLLAVMNYLESDGDAVLRPVTLSGKQYTYYPRWVRTVRKNTRQEPIRYGFTYGDSGTFSPDGRRMVFSVSSNNQFVLWADICSMNTNGTGFRRVNRLKNAEVKCLRWSPDGRSILSAENHYSSGDRVESGIWLLNAKGKHVRKLVDFKLASYAGMDWTSDSKQIVYQVTDANYTGYPDAIFEHPSNFKGMSSHSSIWLMRKDGTGKRKLLDNACHPNWR